MTTRILAISGSLRHDSYNTRLVRFVVDNAVPGILITPYQGLATLPPYNPDHDSDDPPPQVTQLRRAVADSDGLLVLTPEYSYSIPGQLKTALDWLAWPIGDSALTGKPVAIGGASVTGLGTAYAQLALRQILLATRCAVVTRPEVRIGHVHERFDTSGRLIDESVRNLLLDLVDELAALVHSRGPGGAQEIDRHP